MHTAPIGSFRANPFNLHDMLGNVWEWVEDCWNESYFSAPPNGAAWMSGDCGNRILRGGAGGNDPSLVRSAIRGRYPSTFRIVILGFCVARAL